MSPTEPFALPGEASPRPMPGAMVLRLMALVVVAVIAVGAITSALVARSADQEALQRVMTQQSDEVEVVARLLASKLEQSQKVLRTVAESITPPMIQAPAPPDWILQQSMPAVRFFDAVQIAARDGELRMNLRAGKLEKAAQLDPVERETLRRTLIEGKPLVSELMAPRTADARVMLTMPLHQDGSVIGVVAGVLRLQSQGLLPPTLTVPGRSPSPLVVFTRDGTILAHSDPSRVMGHVQDEPGLAAIHAQWLQPMASVPQRGQSYDTPEHLISVAGLPLAQWMVARVSPAQAAWGPLRGTRRNAWWLSAAAVALGAAVAAAAVLWLTWPLTRLRHTARQLLDAPAHTLMQRPPTLGWPAVDGEVGACVAAYRQLLEQARAQHALDAALQEQLHAILHYAPVGIVITHGGQLTVVGHQMARMLGYHPAELQGRDARMLYATHAEYAAVVQRVQAQFAAHGAFDGDVRMVRKDGGLLSARVQGQAVHAGHPAAGTVWIVEDMTAAHEARATQRWERTHDALTQLPNRAAFEERLGALLEHHHAQPSGTSGDAASTPPLAGVLLYLDLDHFTVVNDVAGRSAGDDVLVHVARMIESQVRHMGWVARLGGDEFAVVLPGSTLTRAHALAQQLATQIAAWEPTYQGRSFTLGASVGLVPLDTGLRNVSAVLHAADMACYDAKRAGRNRVQAREIGHRPPAYAAPSAREALLDPPHQ